MMIEFLIAAGVGVVGFAAWRTMSTYNRLMALDERCTTAFADIDALLKHRHDLIPGLVQNVKSVVGQENRVIENLLYVISEAARAQSVDARFEAEQNLGNTINSVFSTIEQMPQMKTAPHFVDLRNSFRDVENRITASRRFYNSAVEEHNASLRQFPGNMIGKQFNLDTRNAYSLGAERIFKDQAVQMQF